MNLFRTTRVRPMIEQIEPRILYSADLNPALASNPALMPQFEQGVIDASAEFTYFAEANAELTRQEVVFVDTATPDYQGLVDGIRNNEDSSNQFDDVLLDSNTDGISQISEYLADRQDISAIHIISQGSEASLQLGQDVLDTQSLKQNAEQIWLWGNALTADADLLIYGCDVAGSDAGRALIDSLTRLTGADVAASTDLTGNAVLGGDWVLEYARGEVETAIAFGIDVQHNCFGVLPTAAITARETVDGDGNGQIVHIRMTAEGALNDDFSDINITVGSYTLAATPYVTNIGAGGALDDVFYVALLESGSADTDATPAVTIAANSNLQVRGNSIAADSMDLIARAITVNVNLPAGGIALPLVVSPPPVVDRPAPVESSVDPETVEQAPTDEEGTENETETVLLAAAEGSTGPTSQSGLVSEVHAINSLSATQTTLRPVLQRSSHSPTESDSPIQAKIWLDFLNSLNSSPNTTQVSGEQISVILDRTDFGDMPDEQFFSLESGLQLSAVALSAGFVSWAIRGAGLFASLLTSLRAWRHMDPLPILKKKDEKEEQKKDWTLPEDDGGHDFDEDIAVRSLWTPGNRVQSPLSDKEDTILASSGQGIPKAAPNRS